MAPLPGMEHIFKKCLLDESEGPGLMMVGREVGSQLPASSALPNTRLERSYYLDELARRKQLSQWAQQGRGCYLPEEHPLTL